MMINEDGLLEWNGQKLTTADVEALQHKLALARAHMEPSVDRDLSTAASRGALAFEQFDPELDIGLVHDSVVVGVRHQGIGWFVFKLNPNKAKAVGEALCKAASGRLNLSQPDPAGANRH
jgi:hypothetical protein